MVVMLLEVKPEPMKMGDNECRRFERGPDIWACYECE